MTRAVLAFLLLGLTFPVWAADSGPSVPYFVSLKDAETNMREGPGEANRIKWIYRHKGLPLEVLSVFEGWRRVRDMDGEIGWVHMALLSRERMAVVTGTGDAPLYRRDEAASELLAQARPGAIGRLKACGAQFCEVEFDSVSGWIERSRLWGVQAGERF